MSDLPAMSDAPDAFQAPDLALGAPRARRARAVARPTPARHQRLQALLDGQSQILAMLARGLPLSAILEGITRWVEAQSRQGVLASILLLDPDGERLLHGAAPSLPAAYNDAIHGIRIGPAVGSCGTAAFTKHPVIVADITRDPRWTDFRELALAHDLRACWSTPLLTHDGHVLGTFAMYYRRPQQPTQDDLRTIQLVTRTAVLAIEHKRAEEDRERLRVRERQALRHAETERRRLRDLVMDSPGAIAVLRGPAHVVELANPMYLRAIGPGRDVLGKPIRDALPELARQGTFEVLDRVYATGEPFEREEVPASLATHRDSDAVERYYNVAYHPTRDDAGAVDGIVVHAVDVTAPVRARRRVEESEERFRTLFELVPVAVYSCDANGVIQEFNQRAVELWGREPKSGHRDERYCGSFKLYYPDGRPMPHDACPMAKVLRGEALAPGDAEILVERPDGAKRNVAAHPRPLKDERGAIIGAITCLYDITDRKGAEEATAYLAAIVSSSADAIASKTLDGIITSWNASAERMFGYTAPEIIGQSVLRLIPPDRHVEEDGILARLRAGERVEHFQTVRMTKDGRLIDVSLTISPIRDRSGKIIGASKIVRDITDRVRLERERSELLGIVAHDLGNPLTAIKARVQILDRKLARGGTLDVVALHGLSDDIARMERLVRDLRDAESIEGGRLVLSRGRFDLMSLARYEVETARTASGRAIALTAPEGPLDVEADQDRLGQVIANLLTNALKYSPADRRVVVTLGRARESASAYDAEWEPEEDVRGDAHRDTQGSGTERTGAPRRFARVSVSDEGPGIPPDALAHLFERFYRVPGIVAREGERRGLGLGLYICRQLIERQGGRITVTSEVGRGSTFTFTLPLADPARPD
ncbi:MAG TPA: PAS domain S-box protein [Ktedonobacterales bacterium]